MGDVKTGLKKVNLAKNRYGISHDGGEHWQYGAYVPSQLNDETVEFYSEVIRNAILFTSKRISRDYADDLVQDGLTSLVLRMSKGLPMPHVLYRYCWRIGVRAALRYLKLKRKEDEAVIGRYTITTAKLGKHVYVYHGQVTWMSTDEMSYPSGHADAHFMAEVNEAINMSDREAARYFSLEKTAFRRAVVEL